MNNIEKTVGSFRAAIQDLLVPELKAIQTELKHHDERFNALQKQMDARFEAMQKHMDSRFDAMQKQIDSRFEAMQKQIDSRFEAVIDRIVGVEKTNEKILNKLDALSRTFEMEKRLANFEGRFSQIEKMMFAERAGKKEFEVA